ncbi:MAG: DinB family protein [Candidatus Acidoferrales bacterium]
MGRSRVRALPVALLASVLGLAGCQREAEPPPIESGQAQEMLEGWNYIGQKLIEMAEDFPAEKYDYRPTEEVRSFGEMLRHVAAVNFRYIRQAQGREYEPEEFAPEKFQSKDDIAALIKRSYEEGGLLLEDATDEQMLEPMKNPYGDRSTSGYTYWVQAAGHAAEHYGNLVTYYRLNGLVPPASRRPEQ